MLLSAHEVRAHVEILDARNDLRDWVIGPGQFRAVVERAVESFAPRCNCGLVLSRKPTVGLVLWSCACGWSCKEAS